MLRGSPSSSPKPKRTKSRHRSKPEKGKPTLSSSAVYVHRHTGELYPIDHATCAAESLAAAQMALFLWQEERGHTHTHAAKMVPEDGAAPRNAMARREFVSPRARLLTAGGQKPSTQAAKRGFSQTGFLALSLLASGLVDGPFLFLGLFLA